MLSVPAAALCAALCTLSVPAQTNCGGITGTVFDPA
jgi:hypothetical protein